MASSSGASAGSAALDQQVMDQRKRKRMISNRESARRSRQRKHKHLDELNAQVNRLKEENGQIANVLGITTQHYVGVEAENSVLRAQMMELSNRLQSLNEILSCVNEACGDGGTTTTTTMMRPPWSLMMGMMSNHQRMMASADLMDRF